VVALPDVAGAARDRTGDPSLGEERPLVTLDDWLEVRLGRFVRVVRPQAGRPVAATPLAAASSASSVNPTSSGSRSAWR
jgi:hypothetical protein